MQKLAMAAALMAGQQCLFRHQQPYRLVRELGNLDRVAKISPLLTTLRLLPENNFNRQGRQEKYRERI